VIQVAILTVSDRSARGERPDASGPVIEQFVRERLGWQVARTAIVADDADAICSTLVEWCDTAQATLIFTTGGTGFAPRDVTPEATRAIIDREAPGLAEAMRAASLRLTPHAMLSRAVCGIRGRTLIVNLPGSPKACLENLETIAPALPHAMQLLGEDPAAEAGHQSLDADTRGAVLP
jgi:molybdenum cofactor synthesis domain-containing protein